MIDPEDTIPIRAITASTAVQDTDSRPHTGSHSRNMGLDTAAKALIAFLLILAFFMGIGMGQTFFAHKSNIITYCAGGVCAPEYHDHCSDWFDLQHP